mgnify:CR=1 FL=1
MSKIRKKREDFETESAWRTYILTHPEEKEEERECHYLHSFFKDSEEKTYAGADYKADLNAYGYNISIKCKGEKNKRINNLLIQLNIQSFFHKFAFK